MLADPETELHTYEGSSRFFLSHELLGLDVGLLKVDMAVLDPERADVAVAIKPLRERQPEMRVESGNSALLGRFLQTQGSEGRA